MRVISKFTKGQSTLEYAILVIIVIGALLTIQAYVRRGIMGRAKKSSDDIGDQYDPGNTNYLMMKNTYSNTKQTATGGRSTTELLSDEETNTYVSQNIDNLNAFYLPGQE